jgi:hypothetical protein
MAYKKVEMAPAHDFEITPEIEGVYLGKQEDVGPNHSKLYRLKTADGATISVWGSTALDSKMSNVGEGDQIRIEYLGKKKSPTAGRSPYKDFAVYIDDGK